MRATRWIFAPLLLATFLSAFAAGTKPNPLQAVKHETYALKNGLTVILIENHEVPIVGVNVNYQVGSKNERPGRTGFAHLFEHMMFQGSKNFNDDYAKALETVGGDVNGGTNTDRTRYCEMVPPSYLERALWLEADRMGFLLDALTQERLSNQISVVQNERRQSYENQPYGMVSEKMAAALYPPDHPYNWPTIGSMADLAAATMDDVKDFFKTYYAPNNASLCIAGDFDPAEAKRLVEKYFGAIPPGPPVSRVETWVPKLPGEVILAIQDRVQLPRTYEVWHTVPIYSGDDAALDVLGDVLGGGKTSRLYQRLVQELQIAQDASAYHDGSQIAGTFQVTLTPRPGHTLKEVEREADAVLKELLEKGVTQGELDRSVTGITALMVRRMQRIGLFGGIPDLMNGYQHYLGDPDRFRWDLQRYLDLGPEQVNAAARKYLGPARVVARVTPSGKPAADDSELSTKFDRSVMPGPGTERPFKLGERQHFTLKNGIEVVLVERHQAPLVEFSLGVFGGSAADPEGKEGLCNLTAAMLQEGAGGLTSKAFAEAVEEQGATLNASAGNDAVTVRLTSLKENLPKSVGLMADLVARPNLAQPDFDRVKALQVTDLARAMEQPNGLASMAYARVLFGDGPYGHVVRGTKAGLSSLSLGDVKAFWSKHGVPKNAVLAVAGDTTKAEVEPLLEKAFGSWAGGDRPAPPESQVPASKGRAIYVVDRPGSAQSILLAGLTAPARQSSDFAPLNAACFALGGGGLGRLYLNLREDKGYTYGAYAFLDARRQAGVLVAQASVGTAVTAPALKEMMAEIDGLAGLKPIAQAELDVAKADLADGYPRRYETPAQVVTGIQSAICAGVSDAEVEDYPRQIKALTLDQVRAEAARAWRPSEVSVVVVGDKAKIAPDLEKLEIGKVVELAVE